MSNNSISCTACGGPNQPEAGMSQMACSYCGAALTIPESLRVKAIPKVEKIPSKAKPVSSLEVDAPDLLRKAEPIARSAWNLYAVWTWVRWALPACLILFVALSVLCIALGIAPVIWGLSR